MLIVKQTIPVYDTLHVVHIITHTPTGKVLSVVVLHLVTCPYSRTWEAAVKQLSAKYAAGDNIYT